MKKISRSNALGERVNSTVEDQSQRACPLLKTAPLMMSESKLWLIAPCHSLEMLRKVNQL